MDSITTAIVTALGAGALSGLTESSKTALIDAYKGLKELLAKKFGASSQVLQAVDHLEAKPTSTARQQGLQEELVAVHAEQDCDLLSSAQHLLTLVQPQQAGLGKYTIQNNAQVYGQAIGDHPTITQQFGDLPKA